MPERILIVDDEKEIADLVTLYLQNENFTVFKCYTAAAALECIANEKLDLAILDVMLPDMSGFEICQRIRQEYNYPVIMLTAKGEATDKITGLTLGADDYMTKPFLPLELVARVKAQLRRYKRYNTGVQPDEDVIIHGGLMLNIKNHECTQLAKEAQAKGDTRTFLKYANPGTYRKVSEVNDRFSYKKAAVGTLVFGTVGAVAGINGKKTVTYQCDKCGHSFTKTE